MIERVRRTWMPLALVLSVGGLMACDDATGPESGFVADRGPAQAESQLGPRSSPADGATVYVVHGINGTDVGAAEAALPVDIYVSGVGCALTDFTFRSIAGPLTLPTGSYDVQVYLSDDDACNAGGDETAVISASGLGLASGDNVSITAHLTNGGAPTASVFVNDASRVPGRTRISPRHAADFGPVDVVVDGAVAYENVANGASATATLRPGEHTVAIETPDNTVRAFEATLDFVPFTLYAAYAVGTVSKGTFEVILQQIPISRRPF